MIRGFPSLARHWRTLPAVLWLMALWLLVHPWQGLWHDSRLYAVQALRRLAPLNYQHDLFFLYGSQDAFTVFSPCYAAAIAAFGLGPASLALQLAGSLLWLAGAARLLACFLRGYAFWLGLVLLVALPSDYGPVKGMFFLAESFPTPRLFAEGLGMLAMAYAVRGRLPRALAALALAFLLHPLMAAATALFGLLFLAEGRWRSLAVLLGGAGALLLALALSGLAPFDRLLHAMDAAWWQSVAELLPVVAWERWQVAECASRWLLAFALVLAAARLAEGWRARFFLCCALVGAAGLLASWLGTGLSHNLLLVQVQPWRTLWLLLLASWIALAWLLARYWQRGRIFRVLLLALLAAAFTRNGIGGWLALPLAALFCQQARSAAPLQLETSRYTLLLVLVAALASAWFATGFGGGPGTGIYFGDVALATRQNLWAWTLLLQGGAAALGAGAMWLAWRARAATPLQCGAAGAVALACLAGAGLLSAASGQQARLMSDAGVQRVRQAFQPLVPPTAVVYWQDDVRDTWFVLQRSSYASSAQLGGAAFNRGTALEGQRRLQRLQQLGTVDSVRGRDRLDTLLRSIALPAPSRAGLLHVCADPALDFVVLRQPLGSDMAAQAQDPETGQDYFLYHCARLRGATR